MSLNSGDTAAFDIVQGGTSQFTLNKTNKTEQESLDSEQEYIKCVEASHHFQAYEALKARESEIPIYGDTYSGEPIQAHQVTLDFTPIPGVDDDEYIIQKCINFWESIYNEPRMKNMMAELEKSPPDSSIYDWFNTPESSSSSKFQAATACECIQKSELKSTKETKTAAGIIRALDPDLNDKECLEPLPLPYYKHKYRSQDQGYGDFNLEKDSNVDVLKHVKIRRPCNCIVTGREFMAKSADDMANIIKEMEEFDKTHPKSMDPPGHPPTLITATMQRVPYSVYGSPPKKPLCNLNMMSD